MSISLLLQLKLLPYVIYLLFFQFIQYWINPREEHEIGRKWEFEYSDTAISFLSFFSFFHSNIIRFQSCEQLDLNAYFSSTRRDKDDLIEPQDFKLPLLSCVEMKLLNSVKWRSSPLVWLKSCWFACEYIILFPIISIYWLLDSWRWSSTSNISSMRRFGD